MLVLQKMGKVKGAEIPAAKYKVSNDHVKWALLKFKNADHKSFKKSIVGTDQNIQVYDTKFVDEELVLLSEVVQQLEAGKK